MELATSAARSLSAATQLLKQLPFCEKMLSKADLGCRKAELGCLLQAGSYAAKGAGCASERRRCASEKALLCAKYAASKGGLSLRGFGLKAPVRRSRRKCSRVVLGSLAAMKGFWGDGKSVCRTQGQRRELGPITCWMEAVTKSGRVWKRAQNGAKSMTMLLLAYSGICGKAPEKVVSVVARGITAGSGAQKCMA